MHERAALLIDTLGLVPHREGGHFREIHRSPERVLPDDGRRSRSALTSIYFLLVAGEISRLHRVASDETWHFHEGDPLEILIASPDFREVHSRRLGLLAEATEPVRVVPSGWWQAARPLGTYSLVSCSVGPGFEFEDFEMLRERPGGATDAALLDPRLRHLV
jgi:predicted cupin superfamily sugar epimerase